ncbi:MAG: putative TonB-dependent receptor [Rhodospirillales bacterium]|nr:putative TonB-dependent receptor [Rhodospirillales bacterium]
MRNLSLSMLFATVSTSVLAFAQPVVAQTSDQPAASDGTGIEEVLVTARRREEKAQTVPIALTSLTTERLQKQDIRSNLDLLRDVPGLNGTTGASLGVSFTFIRGVPGVVSYFDQIPTAVSGVNQSYFFDVSNVQVLKGPQGTLFGLSNDAGAILYEPNKPTNSYEGYVQGTIGNYNRGTVEGVLNLPIDDKLSIRVGGQFQHQDGYIHVLHPDIDLLDQNYWATRFSATFRPTDNFQNDLMVNYFHSRSRPGTFVLNQVNPGIPVAFANAGGPGVGLPVSVIALFTNPPGSPTLDQVLARQKQLGVYTVDALSLPPSMQVSQWNIVDTASFDINDSLTLKNIFGYQETQNSAFVQDIDGSSLALVQGATQLPSQSSGPSVQYNEEIQLLGKAFDDKLTFVVGTFNQLGGYSSSDTRTPYGIGYQNSFGQTKGSTSVSRARTDAVYLQGTYSLSDYVEGLSVTAGGRYSWDKFYTRGDAYLPNGQHAPNVTVIDPISGLAVLVPSTVSQAANFRSPSYTFSIDYQWRPQTLFYITNSRGYKTGGFNNTPTQIFTNFALYKPEHLNNFEGGVKTDFDLGAFDMSTVKGRINLSAYYGVYQSIAVQTTGAYAILGSPVPQLGTPIINVGDGDIYGYDGEITIVPDSSVELSANFAYTRGRYNAFQGPNAAGNGQVLIPGVNFEITPLWKFNIHGAYHLPIDPTYGDLSLTAAYSWTDRQILTDAASLSPQDYLEAYDNLDMTLDWKSVMGDHGLDARLFVTNLLENKVAAGVLAAYKVIGILGYQPAQPRMYGVTVRYAFGGEEEAAATTAAYTPPPAVAPAPSVPKSYLVFFDFNKSDLTPQALTIVDQAAQNAGPAHVTKLEVTGHTDTVGSDAYNMRLSRRRAESVAAELEKDGIPSSEIEIIAKGKRDLLVPTADGVKEPQNRRVQIVYGGDASS